MVEPKHFQKLQHQYFKDFSKRSEIQSSHVLYSSFHPNASVPGDFVVMMEQVFYPAEQEIISLSGGINRDSDSSIDIETEKNPFSGPNTAKSNGQSPRQVNGQKHNSPLYQNSQQKEEQFKFKMQATVRTTVREEDDEESEQTSSLKSSTIEDFEIEQRSHKTFDSDDIGQDEREDQQQLQTEQEKKMHSQESIDSDDDGIKIRFKHQILKYKPPETNSYKTNSTKKRVEYRESLKNQYKRMMALNHKEINIAIQQQESNDQLPQSLLEKPIKLEKRRFKQEDNKSNFIISLWRMYQGRLPAMVTNLEISSDRTIVIYQDKLYFSQDGHYIFFIVMNIDGILEKMIIINANDLSVPDTFEYDLKPYGIKGEELTETPALLWGHKDSLNIDYARNTIRATASPMYGFTSQYLLYLQTQGYSNFYTQAACILEIPMNQDGVNRQYHIVGIFFESIKQEKYFSLNNSPLFKKKKDPRKITLIVKKNHITDPFNQTVKIYKTSFDKIQAKIQVAGALTFTDEIKFEQSITHEELATPYLNCYASKDMQQIIIQAEPMVNQNGGGLVGEDTNDQKKALVFLSQGQEMYKKQSKSLQSSPSQIKTNVEGQQVIMAYSQPVVLHTYRDIALCQNLHLRDDITFLVFNENQQSIVAVKASEVLYKGNIELNKKFGNTAFDQQAQSGVVDITNLQQLKVDGQIELSYMNCFDIFHDQYGRTITLGFDLISHLIAKLIFSVYDDEVVNQFHIEKYVFQFINPFIAFVRNNNYLVFNSIFDPSWHCQFKLTECKILICKHNITLDFLSFVEMYSGSLTIGCQTFYRSQCCTYLTIDENNKVRLNIMTLPVYVECKSAANDCKKTFTLNRFKQEYSIDFATINKEKIIKTVIGKIQVTGKQDVILLVIQYENDILIRPFNTATFFDQLQTGGSKIPMLQQDIQMKTSDEDSMFLFVHTNDTSNFQKICLLQIQPNELPKMHPIYEVKSPPIVQMCKSEEFILTLDETLSVRRFKFSNRSGKLRLYRESELSEEAQTMLSFYKNPQHITMNDTEVYIGPQFFQSYNKTSLGKDANNLFEQYRFKNVEKLNHSNLFLGPVLSSDSSQIMFVSASIHHETENVRQTERTSFQKQLKFRSIRESQAMATSKFMKGTKTPQLLGRSGKSHGSLLVTTSRRGERIDEMLGQSNKEEYDPRTVLEENNFNFDNLNDSAPNQRIKFEILCIPFLGHKSIQLLHKDDYLMEQVQFSTFTMCDDTLIMVGCKMFMFDKMGNPLKLEVKQEDYALLRNEKIQMIRISSNYLVEGGQSLLFKDDENYYIYHLVFKSTHYTFTKCYQYECLKPNSQKEYYHEAKQDEHGNLYQLMIDQDMEDQYFGKITFNGKDCPWLDDLINEIICPGLNGNQTRGSEVDYKNVSMVEEMKDSIQESASLKYDFEILHNKYLIFKSGVNIYFYNILSTTQADSMSKVNLNLRPGVITQLAQCQKANILQFVYVQYCPTKVTFIITWDLETNMEEQILEIPLNTLKPQSIQVFKGVSERLNYYIPSKENAIYDLRYNFPLNYFNGVSACLKLMMKNMVEKQRKGVHHAGNKTQEFRIRHNKMEYRNELKFSSYSLRMLGKSKQQYATMFLTYSYMDFQYMEYLVDSFMSSKLKDEKPQLTAILLQFTKFRLGNGTSILHIMATNDEFLLLYYKCVLALIEDFDYKDAEQFIFLVVYPNNMGITPFDKAIQEHAPRSIEIMLDLMCLKPKHNYSKYIQKHFFTLIELKSQAFHTFLSNCTFKINKFFKCEWQFSKEYMEFSSHTCYLDDSFLIKEFSVTKEEIHGLYHQVMADNTQLITKNQKTNEINLHFEREFDFNLNENQGFEYNNTFDMFKKDCEHKNDQEVDKQNVIFTAVEFPWIFRGKNAQQFISYLTNVDEGSSIFTIPTIQHIIIFQWKHFKKSYIRYKLLPFLIYFIIQLLFATIPRQAHNDNDEYRLHSSRWERTKDGLGIIIIIFATYFLLLEIFKLLKHYYNYQNFFDWMYHLSAIALFCIDQAHVSDEAFRIVAVFVVIQNYGQLFLNLRVFDTTAVLISMIFYIVKDMIVFALIFLSSILCFTNCFYILQGVQEQNEDGSEPDPLAWGNFGMAFLYTYSGAIGNFETDGYETTGTSSWILWLLFFVSSFLMTIVLLNLLIAIMGDTYDQVMQIQKEERLRAKCRLINENEFIFNRDRLFQKSRYVIVAEVDKVMAQSSDDWEGKINALMGYFDSKFAQEKAQLTANFKNLKDNNINFGEVMKQQDSKICELQNMLNKISGQIKAMESKKKVKKLFKRSGNKIREYFEAQFFKDKLRTNFKNNELASMKQNRPVNPLIKLMEQAQTNSQNTSHMQQQ